MDLKGDHVKKDSGAEQAGAHRDIPSLEVQLRQKEDELEAMRNQSLRLQADFENAKKRWVKEQAEFQEVANGDLLRELLEIYDDFERALTAEPPEGEKSTFRMGVEMIAQRMEDFLRSYGVAPIEATGQMFDPKRHEAVGHEVSEDVPESTVLAELRKGYVLNGRVLRPAVVKVSVKPQTKSLDELSGRSHPPPAPEGG